LRPVLIKAQVESSENRNKELTQRVRQQVTGLNRAIAELKKQVSTLTDERDALKAQAPSTATKESPDWKALQDQIVALQQEKLSLETSLTEVRAKAAELSNQTATLVSERRSVLISHLTGFQASVQKERDSLLAEKEARTKSAAQSTVEGTSSAQVIRERDEALASCKVGRL
jgi:nucleoprotein TPR